MDPLRFRSYYLTILEFVLAMGMLVLRRWGEYLVVFIGQLLFYACLVDEERWFLVYFEGELLLVRAVFLEWFVHRLNVGYTCLVEICGRVFGVLLEVLGLGKSSGTQVTKVCWPVFLSKEVSEGGLAFACALLLPVLHLDHFLIVIELCLVCRGWKGDLIHIWHQSFRSHLRIVSSCILQLKGHVADFSPHLFLLRCIGRTFAIICLFIRWPIRAIGPRRWQECPICCLPYSIPLAVTSHASFSDALLVLLALIGRHQAGRIDGLLYFIYIQWFGLFLTLYALLDGFTISDDRFVIAGVHVIDRLDIGCLHCDLKSFYIILLLICLILRVIWVQSLQRAYIARVGRFLGPKS